MIILALLLATPPLIVQGTAPSTTSTGVVSLFDFRFQIAFQLASGTPSLAASARSLAGGQLLLEFSRRESLGLADALEQNQNRLFVQFVLGEFLSQETFQ